MSPDSEERITINTYNTTVHTLGGDNVREGRRLRYMQRDGRFPVVFQMAAGEWSPYLVDIFTTLVEIRWRVMLLTFSLSYILSWTFFGLLYWLIAYVHGDLENPDNAPCVENVRSFTAAFLFSLETQATIGYGFRGMTENCVSAIIVEVVQDVVSCLIDTFVIGIAVAKMASARKRAQTVGFSKCAVVSMRNGGLCLSWRLGDFRGNHILEGTTTAQVIRYVKHPLGSVVVSYQDLDIQGRDIVLATPVTIIHRLGPGSPLYSLGPEDLVREDFELVVSFTYNGDSTGILHQTRASYAPENIYWGQRFQDMVKVGKKHYKVDYALFNQTTYVQVPMLSAEEYNRERLPSANIRSQRRNLQPIRRSKICCPVKPDEEEEVICKTWL
ncbi:inward rectifier potassium channel 16-like [Lampris incognitus]|uniref:inward rectifier potassium channel 16-like n=1 Tax=Lampris incognitus TaxID=2546036 RepID=UPI0024B602B6|nr:inward rectifier potassium channel 16-like [Lampris incognitus]XP_056144075.1 inward rectifier potassium channel 16-like [Lampris incognitus]XP_056144076.1 inward rectifier potassium channel 16-like [Lampris incognitus]